MDIKSVFFQTTLDDEVVQTEPVTFRGRVSAPCPGSNAKTKTLVMGEKANQFKVGNPKNIGTCEAYILFFDRTGTYIDHYTLQPGEKIDTVYPPGNAYYVKFGCSPECGGTAILEYDFTDYA